MKRLEILWVVVTAGLMFLLMSCQGQQTAQADAMAATQRATPAPSTRFHFDQWQEGEFGWVFPMTDTKTGQSYLIIEGKNSTYPVAVTLMTDHNNANAKDDERVSVLVDALQSVAAQLKEANRVNAANQKLMEKLAR